MIDIIIENSKSNIKDKKIKKGTLFFIFSTKFRTIIYCIDTIFYNSFL